MINQSRIIWAINNFKSLKSSETDDIAPALLQNRVKYFASNPCSIFRACLAYAYMSRSWGQVKVTFIPKPGKLEYT
jgi:hypothetical protein